ncbi:MAG TPA: ABC transporter substrate-binding protein [Candidatus Limnocylindrales bacterium]|nr:ABC transporter substrate-binding protein [Candidatus Limnocylindrales bacterium]
MKSNCRALPSIRRFVRLVSLAALLITAGNAAAEQVPAANISLRLKWFIYSSFAHHLVAEEKGLFAAEGLKVDIRPGGVGIDPIKSVAVGEDDLGLASYGQILLARQHGIPVVAIAEEYVSSGVVFLALKSSGITSPKQFVGKKIGWIPGSDTATVYQALMAKEGVDRKSLQEVSIGADLAPFLAGTIDVWTAGYISNQPIVAEMKGYPVNVIDPHDYGIDVGGNVVFVSEETLRTKRPQIEAFIRAMLKSIETARDMPAAEVVDIVLKYNPNLKRDSEIKVWEVTKDRLLSKDPATAGVMKKETWTSTASVFHEFGELKNIPGLESVYTNDVVLAAHASKVKVAEK